MNTSPIRSVFLCEGNDDAWFLSYYLHKVHGWNTKGANWGHAKVPCDIDGQHVIYMIHSDSNNLLAIKSTNGQNNLKSSAIDIWHFNECTPYDPIDNLIVFRDCDDRNSDSLLREMQTWFPCNIHLINNSVSSILINDEYDQTFNILPLIIPFNEPGAIETLLIQSIADVDDEGQFIAKHACQYIDNAKAKLSRFLTTQRSIIKAKYAAVMAIYDPTHTRDAFNQLMMSTPWENSATIHHHLYNAVELINRRITDTR